MNKLYIIIILSLFGCTIKSKTTNKRNLELQEDTKSMNIFGKVKTIREYDYQQFIPDSLLCKSILNNEYELFEFDSSGYLISKTTKRINEQPNHYKYNYDENDNTLEKLIRYDNEKDFNLLAKYILNPDGQVIEEKVRYTGLSSGSSAYSNTEYEYDKNHNLINRNLHISGTTENNKHINIYDKSNRLLQSIEKSINGKFNINVISYKYSKNQIVEKVTHFDPTDINHKTIEKYDTLGRLVSITKTRDSKTISLTIHNYDKYNNTTKTMVYDGNNLEYLCSHIHKYKFDNHNNWISKDTYFTDNKLVCSIKRKIVYN